jgi:hypothetical protein
MRWVSALVAAATVVTGAGLAGCQPATVTDKSRSIYCEVAADAPARDNADKPTKIVATTRYRCDRPGASTMTLTMRLQHQNSGGAWVDLNSTTFTVKGAETVPVDDPFRSRQISAPCTDGAFRTRVTGSSSARGFAKSYDVTGPRSFDPCRPALFSQA